MKRAIDMLAWIARLTPVGAAVALAARGLFWLAGWTFVCWWLGAGSGACLAQFVAEQKKARP